MVTKVRRPQELITANPLKSLDFFCRSGNALPELKGVSGMKLQRDLRVSQKTAWHLVHPSFDTIEQMKSIFANLDGKHLPYKGLIQLENFHEAKTSF